jgi:thiol-disulfide isomerase/thioredoxin
MKLRLIVAALAMTAGTALAFTPPTDEQVSQLIAKVTAMKIPETKDVAERQAAIKARNDAAKEGLAALSLNEATVAQIDKLATSNMFAGNRDAMTAVLPHLNELAKAGTVEGARAAELRLMLTPMPMAGGRSAEEQAKAAEARMAVFVPLYLDAINHPAALDLVKSGKGDQIFGRFRELSPAAIKEHKLVAALEKLIVPEMSVEATAALGGTVVKLSDAGLEKAELDRVLDKVAAAGQAAVDRAGTPAAEKERITQRAVDTVKRAKSSFARGELMNNPAPEVAFTWSSDGKLKNIAELKGNVVVLDFWATWCGPCVASFPHIRDLVARYETAGSPVKVIGVTSLQGYHMKRNLEEGNKPEKIDCKNDPQKEYALMPEFIKDMKMTWTIGFTPDGCFDPYFGVNGIPHLAIIDSTGKVRHNGLHPMHSKEVADKIDELLKEANLKVPAEPMADPEKKDEKKVSAK